MAKKRKLSEQASAPTSSITTRSKAKATSAAATNPSKSSITKSTKSSISTSATTTRKKAKLSHFTTDDELPISDDGPSAPLYKEYTDAFTVPLDDGAPDYLSAMPSEILSEILSYLVVHHDPERAVKLHKERLDSEKAEKKKLREIKQEVERDDTGKEENAAVVERVGNKKKTRFPDDDDYEMGTFYNTTTSTVTPHVFLSLAAMSSRLRDEVESFCRRYLTKHKERYYFTPNAEIEQKATRRSERLKGKPKVDNRVYRKALVYKLTLKCFGCNTWVRGFARGKLANGISCCSKCEEEMFGPQINLTDAMKRYDLRDWMLIATRKPGPRAKKVDFPVINYGTVLTGKPYYNGIQISYRFVEKDVIRVASAVHGDIEAHMRKRNWARWDRQFKRRDEEHRKMKIRYHRDMAANPHCKEMSGDSKEYHQERLEFYEHPDCDEEFDEEAAQPIEMSIWDHPHGYGMYDDVHRRLCVVDFCEVCEDERAHKYIPWLQ
ncbi:hypothetical protein BDY17DRAFT_323910 [Neohortaea acidophila]|uniref:Uncharacterized protein n=1 Tax=Neohortaea acidophila TaxID=245834 RepID=A0A6A6PT43_9PEZI|nr:uncharacterized protein BDY17DRAFT_323910 [Neohortaea acidophila]KAF2483152.1 hypothetical protein BDY17DRAFT_323910 [Neohortaea acidophila]